ncbi:MAG: hypothetical protein A2068_04500 [Ignavibacteria bacterium GWB2_35_6b]|nr:MAG: hypothetical protein A2068_04500 [Ignavibacteria bacterium GWB2_35_6b]
MKKLILLFLTAVTFSQNYAQDKINISAEIRGRSEFDNRDFNSDKSGFFFTGLRSRLGAAFMPQSDLSGFIQIQDSRTFGTEPNTLADTKNVDLHQAYVDVRNIFGMPLSFKGGRMEFNLGPQRLIGSVGWNNVSRSFDGGVLSFQAEKINLHAFAFQLGEMFLEGDSLDQTLGGVFADLNLVENYTIQPFVIVESILKTDNLDRYTLGFYVKGNSGNIFHETEFAYQAGTMLASGRKQDINALMAALNVGYKFEGEQKPTLIIGIDYLSGDDNFTDDDYKVFNTLYATNHKYYGYMDFFVNLPPNTYEAGLTDIHAKFAFLPFEKVTAGLNLHIFNSSADYTLLNGNTAKSFGTEADFTIGYQSSENLNVTGGFSFFSPGEIFEETRGSDTSTWMYLMTTFSF